MSLGTVDPVRVETVVAVPPERAWEVFTAELGSWWPAETHSVAAYENRRPERVVVEPGVGGDIYEQSGDERHSWATILVWDPPSLLRLEWHVNPENPATEVTVTFTAEEGGTRVRLVHEGWDAYPDGDGTRDGYGGDEGWGTVFACLERHLNG
jgi:uncharacterized protein YndB with AHSA1/START domain